MNALNRLKQLLGLPEDAAEETLQAELDKLESLLTPANPAASDLPALPGQPPFPHQAATPGPRCSTFCRLAILRRP